MHVQDAPATCLKPAQTQICVHSNHMNEGEGGSFLSTLEKEQKTPIT